MSNRWLLLGALNGLLAVGAGAFGAHGLRSRGVDDHLIEVWKTGAQYHMYHALALLLIARISVERPAAHWAGWAMLVGIVLFSGSLYAMTLTGQTRLGAITPLGGLGFLVGWALLAFAAIKR
jgi:uncharacterized membrane protein YgdD (TMEM256/DUF423 family)